MELSLLSLSAFHCMVANCCRLRLSLNSIHTDVLAAFVRGDDEGTVHDDATWLLDFYDTFRDCLGKDILDLALNSLANVEGRFGEAPLQSAIWKHLKLIVSIYELHGSPDSRAQGGSFDFVQQDIPISAKTAWRCAASAD